MKIDGACHCGYITYEPEVDSNKTVICHCTDCQTLSGSAFRTQIDLTRLHHCNGRPGRGMRGRSRANIVTAVVSRGASADWRGAADLSSAPFDELLPHGKW
jgi:hypothetical protein